jgi:hypothetical protein
MIGPLTDSKRGRFTATIASAKAVLTRPRREEPECEGP